MCGYCSCGVYSCAGSYYVDYWSNHGGTISGGYAPSTSGTMWIDIGQSGGPNYGTYSGWVDLGDGVAVGYSGADVWHPIRINYNYYTYPVIQSMWTDVISGSTSTTSVSTSTSIPAYSYYEDDSYCDSVNYICTTYWAYCYPVQSCWDNSYLGWCANYGDYANC
jgi:hypothetical protein